MRVPRAARRAADASLPIADGLSRCRANLNEIQISEKFQAAIGTAAAIPFEVSTGGMAMA
jgi:hypothetical protein